MSANENQCTILVIDDDEMLVELLTFKLEQKGFVVISSGDGEDGLSMVSEERPDLVVLDGMMPGMDGIEVLRLLKESPDTKDIPVVMLSARQQSRDVVGGLNLGAAEYIAKPFMPEELILKIQRLLGDKCKS
ncbi:MAG: response regulator [Rhodospirillaceae bacterium]|nr:response regulator [Rhodospirillaceae bacterium]